MMDHPYGAQQVGTQPWPEAGQLRPRARRAWVAPAALIAALAALAVGTVALVQGRGHEHAVAVATTSTAAAAGDTESADRALCTAIAPLMAEDNRAANGWIATGEPGTPQRDAALPKFRNDTEDWAGRLQDVIDAHPDGHPFLLRTLQRFADDRLLLVRNMRPGPSKTYDDAAWADSMTALGGPLSVCGELGIRW
jgi:hypothetical protein